ncbi:MAG TPA: pantoate--beta-alanine ligase [Spirochaetota bacterium]|nr:pantoate--beta-alanine ligase [Spirochaetota bacterium]HOM38804.1 pantoate--beta-alanine ligase [Spirochaetota bacterium]HPQ49862.1 pantoate--beta-alanine ligase [Spirochaetota bacterium]
MFIIKNPYELQCKIKELKLQGKRIGVVPTMGALHEGHLTLVRESKKNNDITIVTIFVNPKQFGPNEDFNSYPRTFESDKNKLEKEGVDFLFYPDINDMYPDGYATSVEVESGIVNKLCGAKRPGHFKGVTTVVSKLFNITLPDNAYFGLKDYQQYLIIRKMVKDLNFPINVVGVPIVREEDGLAMSSRNKYLSDEERKDATLIYKSLLKAKNLIESGEKDAQKIKKTILEILTQSKFSKIDYIEIVDPENLEEVSEINKSVLIAVACFFGKARLIDNIVIKI